MKTKEQVVSSLRVNSDGHKKLSDMLLSRIKMSQTKMGERYKTFSENEEQFSSYVHAKDVDRLRAAKKKSTGEMDYVSIEVPYSYAVVMTLHTYISSVFLSRSPVFQVQARHGEPEMSVQAVEALLDYQYVAGEQTFPLFCSIFDALRYGFSVTAQYWEKETVRIRKFVQEQPSVYGITIPGSKPKSVPVVQEIPGYEGIKLINVRPQDFFPDTRVPLWKFQEGEFCARYFEEAKSKLKPPRYFNLKEAFKDAGNYDSRVSRDMGSSHVTSLPEESVTDTYGNYPTAMFKGYVIQIKISPSKYGLGDESAEELWEFSLSTDGVIIEASPLEFYHGKFMYDVALVEPDAHSIAPISSLERIKPMNDVLSWLINSHFYNVRATLNNSFVVDPAMVVMKDVLNRVPGQTIRLKPEAFGQDVRKALYQLQTSDVTRGNLNDAELVEAMIQRTLGATDNVMGMVNSGGRKTATEVRTSTSFGVNRLKTMCEIMSATSFTPNVSKQIQAAQQFYQGGKKFRLVGDLTAFSSQAAEITPESIAGFFDYVPVDGTLPVDRFAQVQMWQNMLAQIRNYPTIIQQYDIAKIFAWVASLGGLKNIQQFRLNPMDGSGLASQMQAGNLVPMKDAMTDLNRVPDPNRAEGMGATG